MKKRLRKKSHLDEFAVFGHSLKVVSHVDVELYFWDDFLEKVESVGLQFGGSAYHKNIQGVIQLDNVKLNEAILHLDRWLAESTDVELFKISEPWDLYCGTELSVDL